MRHDRCRTVGALQQLTDVAEGDARPLHLRPDEVGIDLQSGFEMGLPIAGEPLRTRQQGGASGQQRDTTVTEADEIARDLKTAAPMIGAHGRNAGHLAIDRHAGQIQRGEAGGEIPVRIVACEQQQAIHPPPAYGRYERRLAIFLVSGGGEHQDIPGALELLFRRVDHVAVERIGEIGDHAADGVARA